MRNIIPYYILRKMKAAAPLSLLILTFSLFSLSTPLSAQTDSLLLHDYQFVKQDDPWLTSQNAAALTRYAAGSMAQAELSLSGGRGGLTNYWESPRWLTVSTSIESYYRYSPRTVFFGSMSYENFSGREMAGSAFINPDRQPFDIVEDSITNTGTKHRDTYRLSGGFGTEVITGLSLGMKMDFTAANYAKYKDLRHKNKLMDLQLTAGIYAPLGTWCSVGAHYLYHRNTESLRFSTYGTSDNIYQSLISYANFTGHLEQFGTEGYTDNSREMPLVTDYNGLGAQFSSLITNNFSIFASYAYTHGNGYYGRKSPFTITYTEHHSDRHQLQARLTHYLSVSTKQQLDLSLDIEQLQNDANNYRELKNASGATHYEYYTPTKTADKTWTDLRLSYTLHMGIHESLPAWTVEAGYHRWQRRQTAYVYPYYRRQDLHNNEFSTSVCRNLVTSNGVWSLTLNGSFLHGSGEPYEDMTFQQPSDKQAVPPSMDAYLWREYQWLTAPQFCIGGSVKYTFILPTTRLKTFAKISLAHRKANEANDYSLGRNHSTGTLTLGCEF